MPKKLVTRRAGDFMIPLDKYPHIRHHVTLREAVKTMEESDIEISGRKSLPRALLVFNEKHELIGMVRRRDIFRGLEPKFLRTMSIPHRRELFDIEVDPNLIALSSGKLAEAIQKQAEQSVDGVMQPITATVDYEDHLAKVIYMMINRNLALLPVLKERKVVGVVRSVDAFEEVVKIIEEQP
ncbi:CBS domain-containing protein [bacterium]|nr:CBS domain-containing protein [bacterium]